MPKYPQSDLIHNLFFKGQPIAAGKGEILLGNAKEPNGIYYLSTGYVKVYAISDGGDEYVHIIYGSGEVFPLIWGYINIGQDPLYYESISDCVLWRISRSSFIEQLRLDSELAHAMSQQLAWQFYMYSNRINNLEYKKIDEKVIYRLLSLASRFGYKNGGETIIDAPITHELFASTVGLTRESVSRVIEKLRHQKLIEKTDKRIHILDMEGLMLKLNDSVNFENWGLR